MPKNTNRKRNFRKLFTLCSASVLAISVALSAVQAEEDHSFNISAQSLSKALLAFSRQSDTLIVVPPELLSGKTAPRLLGTMEPSEALEILLEGTGLVFRWGEDGGVIITREKIGFVAKSPVRVADNGNGAPDAGNNDNDDDEDGEQLTTETDAGDTEVVFVTGTNIRGVKDLAAPTISFTRDEIDEAGFSTLEELFASLPQNLSEINPVGVLGIGTSLIALENRQGAAGVSLRGLGPGSTLVLLNGKRRAGSINGRVFDISAIPLSVIERVEIVTGGGSAIYGSDAVAGVVNLVTRQDFEGAETQVYFSNTSRGGDRFNVSQIFGHKSEKGGFVLAYDYARDWHLDATDAGRVGPPGIITPASGVFFLAPDSKRHSVFFSGRFSPNDRVELYSDVLYSSDKNETFNSFNLLSIFFFDVFSEVTTDQYSGAVGARFDLNDAWQLDVSGAHSVVDLNIFAFTNSPFGNSPSETDDKAKMTQFTAVADGPLFSLGGVEVLAAVGIESRDESYKSISTIASLRDVADDRSIRSVFGELIIPLVAADAERGLRGLEISLAARFDDYSDFGSTFDPQVGVKWGPLPGLVLRGAFSTAFRAPDLFTLGSGNQASLRILSDPMAPGGTSTVLALSGGNPDLKPEEATTWSLGFDYEPPFATWAKISLSYYQINYTSRLDRPALGSDVLTVLENFDVFETLINTSPTAEEFAAILEIAIPSGGLVNTTGVSFDPATQNLLDVFPDLIFFDNRTANIGIDTVSGLDLKIDTTFETNAGTFAASLNGTYYFKFDRQITPSAPVFSQLNRQGKPSDLRLRASFSWTKGPYGAFVFLNYTDSYNNTLTAPILKIKSWTTVDVTLRFDGSKLLNSGVLEDFTVALSVSNLFNQAPPNFFNTRVGLNFDGANASPLGRSVSVRLVKRW